MEGPCQQDSACAYNSTKNEATGYSPFLLFGRHPRIPLDLMFGLDQCSTPTSRPEYAICMTEAYQLAQQHPQQLAAKNKERYDHRNNVAVLEPSNRVLVHNLSEREGPWQTQGTLGRPVFKFKKFNHRTTMVTQEQFTGTFCCLANFYQWNSQLPLLSIRKIQTLAFLSETAATILAPAIHGTMTVRLKWTTVILLHIRFPT